MEKNSDLRLEAQLQKALDEAPSSFELPNPVLNARLKARLHQVQNAKKAEGQEVWKIIPLWYLPALLSIIGNLVFCMAAVVLSTGLLRNLVLAVAAYASLGSIILTIAGIRYASWKDKMTLVLYRHGKNRKGGALS